MDGSILNESVTSKYYRITNWTDSELRILHELWEKGISASKISATILVDLGKERSRSAILGKVFRLGIQRKNQINEM